MYIYIEFARQQIEIDNMIFWRRKYIFDSRYYAFMSSLLTLGNHIYIYIYIYIVLCI